MHGPGIDFPVGQLQGIGYLERRASPVTRDPARARAQRQAHQQAGQVFRLYISPNTRCITMARRFGGAGSVRARRNECARYLSSMR